MAGYQVCSCGYKTQKGGGAMDAHQRSCGNHRKMKLRAWKGDQAGKFKSKKADK